MTDTEYKARLASGAGGAFLFFGEEDYLRRHWLAQTRKTYVSEGDAFNHIILYGVQSIEKLLDIVAQPPFMADKKLVELHEVSYRNIPQESLDALLASATAVKEQGDTVLVLVAGADDLDPGNLPKKPSAIYKKLTEAFEPVAFDRVTPGKLTAWAGRHFAHEQIIAEPRELDILVERCGTSMTALAGEIDKLSAYIHAGGRDRLTVDDILSVTCQNIENDTFALSNAVLNRNRDGAFEAVREMKISHTEPIIALSGITKVCCDLTEVSKYLECGLSQSEISSRLNMHSYKTGLYLDAVRRWGDDNIASAIEYCLAADEAVKSSRKGYIAIELLLTQLFG